MAEVFQFLFATTAMSVITMIMFSPVIWLLSLLLERARIIVWIVAAILIFLYCGAHTSTMMWGSHM